LRNCGNPIGDVSHASNFGQLGLRILPCLSVPPAAPGHAYFRSEFALHLTRSRSRPKTRGGLTLQKAVGNAMSESEEHATENIEPMRRQNKNSRLSLLHQPTRSDRDAFERPDASCDINWRSPEADQQRPRNLRWEARSHPPSTKSQGRAETGLSSTYPAPAATDDCCFWRYRVDQDSQYLFYFHPGALVENTSDGFFRLP